jgi:tryptophan-rich sensory protein
MLALMGFVGFTLLVGVTAGLATSQGVRLWYPSLTPPPGTPPNLAFPIAWTTLYVLMGIAAWRVWQVAPRPASYPALRLWGWQLLVNAAWSPTFFVGHAIGAGLLICLLLLVLVIATLVAFARQDRLAAILLAPYPIWVAYATWLNAGFWWLNGRPFP